MAVGLSVVLLGVLCLTELTDPSMASSCLAVGGVDNMKLTAEQLEAQQNQTLLSCANLTGREHFIDDVLAEMGLNRTTNREFYTHVPTFVNSIETCRAAFACPDAEPIWCINVYHPTERIQMCMNTRGIINATYYARLLQLQCYFSVPTECPSGQPDCIRVAHPTQMLDRSVIACSVSNESAGCSSTSVVGVFVEVTGHETEKPLPHFENSTELVLGQTNLLLCTVYFFETSISTINSAEWFIDDVPVHRIHETPYCYLDEDCDNDTLATTRGDRVRAYEHKVSYPSCPSPLLAHEEWLWIDNATEEDASHTYSCRGFTTFFNPFPRNVVGELSLNFTTVQPLAEIEVVETPPFNSSNGGVLYLQEGSEVSWTCKVTAGEGDSLQWLYNGRAISSVNTANFTQDVECPSLWHGELFSLQEPAEELGYNSRGLVATLIACDISINFHGVYQCLLQRPRGDPVEIWSANIDIELRPLTTEPKKSNEVHLIVLYVGVSTSVVVMVTLLCCVLLCVLKLTRFKARQPIHATNFVLSTEEGTLTMEMGKTKELSLPYFSDPMEFPREKITLLDSVLGEGSFGRVIKARADGIIMGSPERDIVAIKTCRENSPQHEYSRLWDELQLMKRMKPHENIVNLLGYCTTPAGPLYLIVEYAMYGNLKDYLNQCQEAVRQLNHAPRVMGSRRSIRLRSSVSSGYPALRGLEKIPLSQQSSVFSDVSQSSKTNVSGVDSDSSHAIGGLRTRCLTQDSGFCGDISKTDIMEQTSHEYTNCKGLLFMEDVTNFAYQIACGLQHLEELGVVHCDLAARNILIADRFELKIGDFGMAKDMSCKEHYGKFSQGQIPAKWSAPEVLLNNLFSHRSDVWSYGVVLWEIFSYGQQPYPAQKIGHSLDPFIEYVMDGGRLSCPDGCPAHIYDLMLNCWQLQANSRPTATELVDFFTLGEVESASLASQEAPTLSKPVHFNISEC